MSATLSNASGSTGRNNKSNFPASLNSDMIHCGLFFSDKEREIRLVVPSFVNVDGVPRSMPPERLANLAIDAWNSTCSEKLDPNWTHRKFKSEASNLALECILSAVNFRNQNILDETVARKTTFKLPPWFSEWYDSAKTEALDGGAIFDDVYWDHEQQNDLELSMVSRPDAIKGFVPRCAWWYQDKDTEGIRPGPLPDVLLKSGAYRSLQGEQVQEFCEHMGEKDQGTTGMFSSMWRNMTQFGSQNTKSEFTRTNEWLQTQNLPVAALGPRTMPRPSYLETQRRKESEYDAMQSANAAGLRVLQEERENIRFPYRD